MTAPASIPPSEPAPGPGRPELGSIRLLARIGRGGMSTVQVGFDREHERFVAVKILFPEVATEERARARFHQESRIYERLRHPNIVGYLGNGEREDGTPYIVLEFVKGTSLRAMMNRVGRLPPGDVLEILEDLTKALDHAHSRGVIHRDIKPQNIILNQDGILKLIDFGIARMAGTSGISTATGQVLATYSYAPPEQNQGKDIDQTADLYALGSLAWEMLVGRRFLTGTSPPQIVLQQTMGPPGPPSAEVPGLPGELDHVVQKLCMPYPEDRYRSAAEVWHALRKLRRTLQGREHSLLYYGDDVHEKWVLAKNAFNNGQLSLAMSLAKYIVKKRDDFAPAHFMLGKLFTERGLPFNASDSFQRALALQPSNADYMLDFSLALLRLGRYQEAHREVLRLLTQDPKDKVAQGFQEVIQESIEVTKAAELEAADASEEAPLWFDTDVEPEGPDVLVRGPPVHPGAMEQVAAAGGGDAPPSLASFPPIDVDRVRQLSRMLPGLGEIHLGETRKGVAVAAFSLFLVATLVALALWTGDSSLLFPARVLVGIPALFGLVLTWRFAPAHAEELARRLHRRGYVARRRDDGDLEISIGHDRGVTEGQVYEVRRAGQLLGEIYIQAVQSHEASGPFKTAHRVLPPPAVGDPVHFLRGP